MMKNKILFILLILALAVAVAGCNNNQPTQPQEDALSSDQIVYDKEVVAEKYLKERISDATAIYYKSSESGEFGNERYLFEVSLLPDEYTELDYIQSTSSQSIDTGIKYAESLTFDLKFSDYTTPSNTGGIFGTEGWLFSLSRTTDTRIAWCAESDIVFRYNSFSPYKTYTVQCGKDFMTINGTELISVVSPGNYGTQNITLFKSFKGYASLKLYYFKIFDSGEVVRNYIPCYRNYDEAVGLYDLITKRFYCNSTEYNFISAPIESERLPNAYQQVEYIESTGTQFINTGIISDNEKNFKLIARQSYTTTALEHQIIGFSGNAGCGIGTAGATWWEQPDVENVEANTTYTLEWIKFGANWTKRVNDVSFRGTNGNVALTSDMPMLLFAAWLSVDSDSVSYFCQAKLYACDIYEDDKLIRAFVPAIRTADYAAGLYDTVHGVFYENAGSGTFLVGEPVQSAPVTSSLLPSTFQQVEYIKSNGMQFIDTRFVPDNNTGVEIKFSGISFENDSLYVYGSGISCNESAFELYPWNNKLEFNYGNSCVFGELSLNANEIITAYQKKTAVSFSVNDGESSYVAHDSNEFECPYSLFLFALHREESILSKTEVTLYSCKIWDGDMLVRDFIPCYRKSDSAAGLYDIVNDEFYQNAGSGKFGVGSPVELYDENSVAIQNGYQPVEYLEQINPEAGEPSQYNRCEIDSVVYNRIEARVNVVGSGSSGGIMLSSSRGDWWKTWQGEGTETVTMTPAILTEDTWTDVTWDCEQTYTGLWTSGWADPTNYWAPQNLKIAYIKTYNNTQLTGYFIPCYRMADKSAGLFDTMHNVFYTNVGTGTFLVGKNVMEDSSSLPNLPSSYQLVDYIESTASGIGGAGSTGQQIDTGLKLDMEQDQVEITFQSTKPLQNGMILASSQSDNFFWFYHYVEGMGICTYTGVAPGEITQISKMNIDLEKHTFVWKNKQSYMDDFLLGTDARQLGTTDHNLFICSWGDNYFYSGKIYSVKIWKAGVLERNMVPCYRKSDFIAGMYDLVHGVFYTNTGEGSFLSGNPVYSFAGGYQVVEYIETTGTQYIKTGIVGEAIWEYDIEYSADHLTERQLMGHGGNGGEYWGIYNGYFGRGDWNVSTIPVTTDRVLYRVENRTLGGKAYVNSEPAYTFNYDINSENGEALIFALKGNSGYYFNYCKLYGCKVYANDGVTLLRNFVPVINNADGQAGLYDYVTETFYTNSGTGDFICGSNTPNFIAGSTFSYSDFLKKYDTTKCLTSSGMQYIDTGITPTSDVAFSISFGTDDVFTTDGFVFGCGEENGIELFLQEGNWVFTFGSENGSLPATPTMKTIISFANKTLYISMNGGDPFPVKVFESEFVSARTLTLFATNRADDIVCSNGIKIYSFTMSVGNKKCDLIPVLRQEDDEYGMFDNAKKRFVPSAGAPFATQTEIFAEMLPEEYRLLEYVEGCGKQYFDTGITASSGTLYELDATSVTPTSIIGTTTGMCVTGNQTYRGEYFYYLGRSEGAKGMSTVSKRTVFKQYNNYCYKDDILVHTYTPVVKTDTQTMFLFARNKNGEPDDYGNVKIYSCKIYTNRVLERYYIPAIRIEDGEIGMYDVVTGVLFTNVGEGEFSCDETPLPHSDVILPGGYRRVEYLEGTGTQFFDMDVTINKEDVVVFESRMQYTSVAKFWSGCNPYLQYNYEYFRTKEAFTFVINYESAVERITVGEYVEYENDWAGYNYMNSKFCILLLGDKNETYYTGTTPQPARIYWAKLTKNGKVIFDCIPCIRESDGEVGLYDIVTNRFFTNLGLGEVLHGDEVNNIPTAYERVDFIEYTGTQSIVLPYSPTQRTRVETSFSCSTDGSDTFPLYSAGENLSLGISNGKIIYTPGETIDGSVLSPNEKYSVITSFDAENALSINETVFSTPSVDTVEGINELTLFGYAESLSGSVRIFRITIFEKDRCVLDFIPCCRKYDGKPGLYERITGKFYSSFAKEFMCSVSFETEKVNNLYEETDYVYFDDEHYFDFDCPEKATLTFRAQFDAERSNGKFGYTDEETCWRVSGGNYVFYGSTKYPLGALDAIVDEYSHAGITRYLNGEQVATIPNASIPSGTYRIGTKFNDKGEQGYFKLYQLKIEQDDVLVAEFHPAIRKSDHSIGLLDIVTNTFYVIYDNKDNLSMGNVVGHKFSEGSTLSETSEKDRGDVLYVCEICGKEIHNHMDSFAYKVEFNYSIGVKEIKVFHGYDLGKYEVSDVAYSRNQNTNNFSRVNAQVYFEVVMEEGFVIEKLYTEGSPCTLQDDNVYILSHIPHDMTVYILVQKQAKE